jgi:uncharacterized protein YyaL (SSP411 family)
MSNHLIGETSPYLRQHAGNPVDWYPWGQEALQKAREEDKPIFLSIGYSACHWCHVMAHESFENERVAAILNEHFVSIKVDREERPDLDRIYMSAVQAMTGGGGWPMSVFVTPDGKPFYGGTYYPPTPRYGMPAFADVLLAVHDAWRNRQQDLVTGSERVAAAIEQQSVMRGGGQPDALRPETVEEAFRNLRQDFDWTHGGWGKGPKFPQPMALEFLLRYHYGKGDTDALRMVTRTLDAMARGGVYDQVGGGFHRYSVDERWLVPHFEKMLYDNAQLARVYLHAWQVTGEPFFRAVVEEILDYVVREMADPAGGFYATQDADSEGQEGKFFLWRSGEIRDLLGQEVEAFMAAYGVTEEGNFEGRNILELTGDLGQRPALSEARRRLLEGRERRVHPGRDEKVLTSWNGLMLAAFAEAARVLDRPDYRQVAERSADFLLRAARREDGRLWHTWKDGVPKINGYLEDYADLADGLIELYETTFDPRWYEAAHELAEAMIAHFGAPGTGFFDTSDDHEALISRPRELQDNATPSGNAMAASVLLRLAGLAAEPRYAELARETLASMAPALRQYPLGFGQWLAALDYALARSYEIGIVGRPAAGDTQRLLAAGASGYRPHQVIAVGPAGARNVPLLLYRDQVDGRATAHVCVTSGTSICLPPITDPEQLEAIVEEQ